MTQQIRCAHCGELFTPIEDNWANIQKLAARQAPLVAVKCTKCFEWQKFDPAAVLRGEADKPIEDEGESEEMFRCPMPQCIGWVCLVEEDEKRTLWGCGEYGKVWRKKSGFDKAISKIVKRFPYRKKGYIPTDEGWGLPRRTTSTRTTKNLSKTSH